MKKRDITGGLLLILLAAYLVLNRLELVPDVHWFRLIVTGIMGYIILKSIRGLEFFGMIMPLCVIGCLYDKQLGIEALTPWTLLLAGLLLSGGLSMIFRKRQKKVIYENYTKETNQSDKDGRMIHVQNSFSSVSKYVNSDAFSEAFIDNSFGSCNVYFNNAVMANGNAFIKITNSFGDTNLYLPKTWRIEIVRNVTFGDVRIYGSMNADMEAPFLKIQAESSFGGINIYFE